MKAKLKKLCLSAGVVAIALSVCCVAGCAQETHDGGINSGFGLGFEEKYYMAYAGIKSGNSEFDVNNVALDFSFGARFADDIEEEKQYGLNIEQVKLYFINDEGDEVFMRKTDDNFTYESYRLTFLSEPQVDDHMNLVYAHTESLTIPSQLFYNDSGTIYFEVRGRNLNDGNSTQSEVICGTGVRYYRTGDNIRLAAYAGAAYGLEENIWWNL